MTAASDGGALPVLYSFRRCPYAMRARLALMVSGQNCELREVVLRDKPQALRDASAKATVPVLVEPSGNVIEQSLDIMCWALSRADPDGWLMPTDGSLAEMLALIAACDEGFKPQLDRYKYPERHGVQAAVAREEASAFLSQLEQRLAKAPFLFGHHAALADMAIAPFIRQFAGVDAAWFAPQWPSLQRWLTAWEGSALFARVMHKYAQWKPGSAPVVFGATASASLQARALQRA
jgi:glutathione S-transferase